MLPEDAARIIEKSVSHLRNVERGEKPLKLELIARLARTYGVPHTHLLADPPNRPSVQPRAAEQADATTRSAGAA